MESLRFEAGDIVAGLEPDDHVEIRRIAPFGNKTLIEGVTVITRREIRRPLTGEDLGRLTKVRGTEYTFSGNADAFLLGVEAQRIHIAYQFDPLFAVNSSVVDVLPHQVEAVYRYLLPLPRIRFLLADDTGAAKTIMTGLLIKELLFRGVLNKVLIITPGGLTKQWQEDEMRDKFGLNFRLVNRASFEAEPAQFARSDDGLFITSIDFIARHEGCLNAAKEQQWDMIVVLCFTKVLIRTYHSLMSKTEILEELANLTSEERQEIRLKLAELDGDHWLDADDPLTDAEKALLNARLAAYEKDPDAGSSWDEVESRIRARLSR
jgi:SNF2 family DNA or RNA helicase